jgi:hypothetical protein
MSMLTFQKFWITGICFLSLIIISTYGDHSSARADQSINPTELSDGTYLFVKDKTIEMGVDENTAVYLSILLPKLTIKDNRLLGGGEQYQQDGKIVTGDKIDCAIPSRHLPVQFDCGPTKSQLEYFENDKYLGLSTVGQKAVFYYIKRR